MHVNYFECMHLVRNRPGRTRRRRLADRSCTGHAAWVEKQEKQLEQRLKTLGAMVSIRRRKLGMTQEALDDASTVSKRTITAFEGGKRLPEQATCAKLEYSLGWLIGSMHEFMETGVKPELATEPVQRDEPPLDLKGQIMQALQPYADELSPDAFDRLVTQAQREYWLKHQSPGNDPDTPGNTNTLNG